MFMKDSCTICKVQHSGKRYMSHRWPFIRSERRVFVILNISLRFLSGSGRRDILEVSSNGPSFQDELHHVLESLLFLNQSKSVLLSVLSWDRAERSGHQRCVFWTSLTETLYGRTSELFWEDFVFKFCFFNQPLILWLALNSPHIVLTTELNSLLHFWAQINVFSCFSEWRCVVISGWPEGEGVIQTHSCDPNTLRLMDFEGLPPNMSVISHELMALQQQQLFRPT